MRNVLLDAALIVLLVAELSFHFLPKVLHEVLGAAMTAAIIWHVVLNRRRLMSSLRNSTPQKIFTLTLDAALVICAAIIFATGVCMSNYLFVDVVSLELRRNMLIHRLHVATPYAFLILTGVHLGWHWRELWQRVLHATGAAEFYLRRAILFKAAAIILLALGVVGLFMNRVVDRLLLKHIFATPATDLPAALFATLILGTLAFFATAGFMLKEKIFVRRRV